LNFELRPTFVFLVHAAPEVLQRPSPAPLPAIQSSPTNIPPQTRNAKVILTLEERIGTPLPAIHKSADDESDLSNIQLPNGPIVLLLGEL